MENKNADKSKQFLYFFYSEINFFVNFAVEKCVTYYISINKI